MGTMNRIPVGCIILTILISRCCLASSVDAPSVEIDKIKDLLFTSNTMRPDTTEMAGASANAKSRKSGDATYYNLGLTACGTFFTDNDFVAAIGFSYFTRPNPNTDPMCGRNVRVTDPSTGKTVIVTIQDKCASCSPNDIDLSPAAFQQLRDLSVGRFRVDWDFV